jgi:uncharacterized membrane protein (UPF0136 family)
MVGGMKTPVAALLFRYGMLIIILGVASVLFNAHTGAFGYNPAAKSGLISGTVCGGLAILWGWLARRGVSWASAAAVGTAGLFLAAFAFRMVLGWMALARGDFAKWFAVTLITVMTAATAALVAALVRSRRRRR